MSPDTHHIPSVDIFVPSDMQSGAAQHTPWHATLDASALDAAVQVLKDGGLIIFPTETTYGLGADATNPKAIEKLYAYKTQRHGKPISIVVTDAQMADQFVERNQTAVQAYETFLPGPVTVVSVGKNQVAPGVESQAGTLGIRIPDHPVPLALVEKLGRPITATSANTSGKRRPYSLQDILDTTSKKQQSFIDLFVNAGTLPPKPPSSVIDTSLDSFQVVRHGEFSLETTTTWDSHSPQETQSFGNKLAVQFASDIGYRPVIFALEGEMGAGKTHLTKGLAAALHVMDQVTSPSYTLVQEYEAHAAGTQIPLVHVDAWRVEHPSEWTALGLEAYLPHNPVLVIEWANTQLDWLQQWKETTRIVRVQLTYGKQENDRHVRVAVTRQSTESSAL